MNSFYRVCNSIGTFPNKRDITTVKLHIFHCGKIINGFFWHIVFFLNNVTIAVVNIWYVAVNGAAYVLPLITSKDFTILYKMLNLRSHIQNCDLCTCPLISFLVYMLGQFLPYMLGQEDSFKTDLPHSSSTSLSLTP